MEANTKTKTVARSVIAVVGGMYMDLIFETLRMPEMNDSLQATALAMYPGGKGSNVAIAIARAQLNKPRDDDKTIEKLLHPNSNKTEVGLKTEAELHLNRHGNAGPIGKLLELLNSHKTEVGLKTEAELHLNGHGNAGPIVNGNAGASSDGEHLSVAVCLNTAVGDDVFGKELKKNLEINRVDISGVQILPGRMTGTCAIFIEKASGATRGVGYRGANLLWVPQNQESVECLAGGRRPDFIICQFEMKSETVEKVLEIAVKDGVDTLLNPSPASFLVDITYSNVTHLIVNEKEASIFSGIKESELDEETGWKKAAKFFLGQGVQNFVITLGANGAFFANKETEGHVDGVKGVKVQDCTGAGDTFNGVYALEVVRQKQQGVCDIRKAVELGCKAAAKTVEQVGAQESIPWKDEIHNGAPFDLWRSYM